MKELSYEVLKIYGEIDKNERDSIRLCSIKWNGREPKGYDIRKYNHESDRYGKGIIIPYDELDNLICSAIESGLCNIDKIYKSIDKYKSTIFSNDDFENMFSKMNEENTKYKRDRYGLLRNKNGKIVIPSRRRK